MKPYHLLMLCLTFGTTAEAIYLMYLTGQHPIPPLSPSLISEITHVALAFMPSTRFIHLITNSDTEWPLFTTVEETRSKFNEGTKVLVAIGGWGDAGFEEVAGTEEGRERFATNVWKMVESTGADGVDIDWEYPGGNGEDYLTHPNPTKSWQITAYPLLLASIRNALGPSKIISAAVPGLPRDMLAFTPATLPQISSTLDFFNIMTYDLMNRRDNVTKHHAGITASLLSIDTYVTGGIPASKLNLGFAFYVKWYKTSPTTEGKSMCKKAWQFNTGMNCPTALLEDPKTGSDLGRAGAFSWHDTIPEELSTSFNRAKENGKYDDVGGGWGYWDEKEDLWWSWETTEHISRKVKEVARERRVGGVFAWGLGEDGDEWAHLKALDGAYKEWKFSEKRARDEL